MREAFFIVRKIVPSLPRHLFSAAGVQVRRNDPPRNGDAVVNTSDDKPWLRNISAKAVTEN